jgi:hypothetical protein
VTSNVRSQVTTHVMSSEDSAFRETSPLFMAHDRTNLSGERGRPDFAARMEARHPSDCWGTVWSRRRTRRSSS